MGSAPILYHQGLFQPNASLSRRHALLTLVVSRVLRQAQAQLQTNQRPARNHKPENRGFVIFVNGDNNLLSFMPARLIAPEMPTAI